VPPAVPVSRCGLNPCCCFITRSARLALTVERRRTALHRRFSRLLFGVFALAFGVIETVLVVSIDGMLYPFQWGDLLSALAIFTLLTMIFFISFVEPGNEGDL
jgi:hypothetical protein